MASKYSGTHNGFGKLVITQLGTVKDPVVQNILRQLSNWCNNLVPTQPVVGQVLTAKPQPVGSINQSGPYAGWATGGGAGTGKTLFNPVSWSTFKTKPTLLTAGNIYYFTFSGTFKSPIYTPGNHGFRLDITTNPIPVITTTITTAAIGFWIVWFTLARSGTTATGPLSIKGGIGLQGVTDDTGSASNTSFLTIPAGVVTRSFSVTFSGGVLFSDINVGLPGTAANWFSAIIENLTTGSPIGLNYTTCRATAVLTMIALRKKT